VDNLLYVCKTTLANQTKAIRGTLRRMMWNMLDNDNMKTYDTFSTGRPDGLLV
jgi:hypothetical protein